MSLLPSHAVVCTAPGRFSVERVGVEPLGPNDVLIRSLFTGVSTGTDKWVLQGRFQWMAMQFPIVPGYQRYGVIEAIGDEVESFTIGQHVVATASRPFDGAFPAWGGHASLAVSDAGQVYDAAGIEPERASLFVSGQVGFNAASRIQAVPVARVAVFGDGIIGVSGALSAVARGFDVLLVGRHEERMAPLRGLSITTADGRTDARGAVSDWEPVAVIDTVQSDESFSAYIDALPRASGSVVFSGHTPDGVTSWGDMALMQQRELTAHFISGWAPSRIEGTLELMRNGAMPLDQLAGPLSSTAEAIVQTMTAVATGRLGPVAAVLDWRDFS